MKKKITLLMMLAFLGLNIGALRAQDPGAYPGGGGGVQGDPYLVSTVEQMQWIANYVNSGTIGTGAIHCELQNDIDLSSINWVAIGCNGSLYDDYTFSGSFDGKNHTVTLKIDATEYADDVVNVGLFGAANGTIKNLTVAGEINGGEYNAAGICCRMSGEILNCHNVAKVISNEGTACGICVHSTEIAGSTGVNITDCSNFGSISGIEACGILGNSCASHYNDHIKNCGNYGTIIGYGVAAGIMGSSDEDFFDQISGCYNFGSIEAGAFAAGIKYGGGGTIFENCFNSGSVTAKGDIEEYPFGIAGGIFCFPEHGRYMEMVGSYNAGIVSGHGIAGGLIGILPELSEEASEDHLFILSSYNIGNVNCGEMEAIPDFDLPAGAYAGSIVGLLLEDRLSFTNVYYDKQMCPVGGVNGVDKTGITPLLTEEMTDPDLDMGGYNVAWGETPLFDIPLFTYTEGLYPQSVFFADEYEEVFSPTALQKAASIVSVTPAFLQDEENVNEVKTDFEVGNENGVTWATTSPFDYDNNGNVSVTGRGAGTLTVSKTEGGITLNKVIDMTSVKCWAGSGTEADPYQIVDADGLVCLAEKVNAGESYAGVYFKVTADIDLSSVCGENVGGEEISWVPIGTAVHPFSGIFDGNEKTISNLYINEPTESYQGLFGYAVGAEFKDFAIADFYINFMRNGGALCAEFINASGNKGIISGCSCTGTIKSEGGHAGALCGDVNYAIIQDCSTGSGTKVMSNVSDGGGLIGWCQNSDLTGCSNYATVTYNEGSSSFSIGGANFGGICGRTDGGSFTSCVNYGTVDFSDDQYGFFNIGGISGDTEVSVTEFTSCENRGKISGHHMLGGIVGSGNLVIESCTNYGEITAVKGAVSEGLCLVGGICGALGTVIDEHSSPVLYNCSNESTGTITADGYAVVGGIVGALVDSKSTSSTAYHEIYMIENCSNAANVTGADYVGGVVGVYGHMGGEIEINNHRIINNCSNSGSVTGNGFIGGICGGDSYATLGVISIGGKIANCENTGSVTATNTATYSNGGGIIADGNKIVVENCTNSGEIEGFQIVGGICGKLKDSEVTACQNSGAVTGILAGGICGKSSNDGTGLSSISGCYNTGNIIGLYAEGNKNISIAAGICGEVEKISITNCYNTGTIHVTADIEPTISAMSAISNAAAGIVATASRSEVHQCYNLGAVGGAMFNGGICGFISTNIDGGISQCYNLGNVEGNSKVSNAGGIVGDYNTASSLPEGYQGGIQNCYNAGIVKGYGAAAGIAAYCQTNILNSYNSGYVSVQDVEIPDVGSFEYAGGVVAMLVTDAITPTVNNCYYDKQMCPVVNEYFPDGTPLLTSAMTSEDWIPGGSAFTVLNGLYPQLTAFATSTDAIDNEASLVSVRPMFLAETDNVDHVYTSPFTVGIDDDEEWSHVSGEVLLTFNADGTVEWENYGTETVAVTNKTHDFITKQIKLNTLNLQDITWVDWVTEAPSGFNPANIDSPEDLAWFISYVNGFNGSAAHPSADGEITADIDMSEHYWVPIGFNCGHIREGFYRPYGGSFEGNYHNIDGIRIKWEALKNSPVINALPTTGGKDGYRDNYDCIGMFGLMNGGSIRNLNLASATIEDDLEGEKAMTIGGIVGETRGTKIYSCVSNATITASRYQKIGGMVGEAKVYSSGVDDKNPASDRDDIVESVFDNCMSTATLTGLGEMGGIVGVAEGASLVSCYSYAQFLLAGDDTKDSGGATIGGLVGRSGRNYPSRLENCYVRMREDGKSELNKGGGSDFIVGLLIGSDNGGEVSYCYAPENTGFEYIGQASGGVPQFERATSIEDIFGTSKGDDYYIGLAVQESENSYYVADLVRSNGTIEVNSCSADVIGEKVVLQCYPEWEIRGDSDQGFVFNDGKYDMSCTSDGKLEFHYDEYSSYWDIESLTTAKDFGGFRISNKAYPSYSLALFELDGNYVIGAVNYESYKDNPNYNFTFDIFAGRILPNLHGVGTYTPATYPYTYNDPKGGTVVTLDYPEDPEIPEEKRMVVSGETTLLDALNNWTLVDFYNKIITTGYGNEGTDWARFGSSLNGDYPIHCYYEPDNVKYGDVALPTAKVVSTPDKMNGIPFRYYSRVSDALAYYNAQAAGGIMGVYGSDDMRDAAVRSNDDNVDVYVNAVSYVNCPKAKEEPYGMITFFGDKALRCSNDWYVSLLQGSGSTLNVHSGFYLDNSDASSEVGGKAYDWHMVSSPLAHVPVGIAYAYDTQQPYMTPANCSWDDTKDGLFPTDTPRDSYDFYAYSEPDYHWINLKQNSASHYHQDGANEPIAYTNDTELTAGHGYLIAMDKEVFMQTSGTLNNGDIEVPVTYSGAHNKGLNFLGNPYMSSLDFDEFATANGSLWEGGAYAESYITLDADKKGYITYAKGQSENPEGLSRYVWPNQGFYIAADKAGMATFTNAMRVIKTDAASYFRGEEPANYALVNLKATDSEGSRDMLTVELGRPEVGGARKVKDVENGNGILYSHYQGGDYSIVFTEEGISQVPVWFESREADSYTMTWSTYNGTFSYLHLIDNLTGCDVDMLANSEYRFTSSTSDYASRFKLVFEYTGVEEDIDSDADGTFAFQMGEQIVVNGEGTLEIVDVQGRILRSERLSGVQSVVVPSVAKGLYLLRLSGSDSVKVQKIVIK